MKTLQIRGLDVFTDQPFHGNPAAVVPHADGLSPEQMQAIAGELRLETTFVLKPDDRQATFRFRYFVPLGEINTCGHGTVGTIWSLAEEGLIRQGLSEVVVETLAGSLHIGLEWEDQNPRMIIMDQLLPEVKQPICSVEEAAQAIGIAPAQIVVDTLPMMNVSTARAKLLIPISDWQALDNISLNKKAMEDICRRNEVTGLYPFTLKPRNPRAVAEARQFPYGVGFTEDPVTGVAICALGAYLVDRGFVEAEEPVTRLLIEQGYTVHRPGAAEARIHVENGQIVKVQIAGRAITVSWIQMRL